MPRNLVICCDGANNEFGVSNTNVIRLIQALNRDPAKQRLHYNPGVGTLPEPGFVSALGKWFSKVRGLAFGTGLTGSVEDAYSYLMDSGNPATAYFCLALAAALINAMK